ncbi:MAG: HTTM domain-containing protein, partial [Planctomycetaceae bacterium]|nr:HTTM domain-containing protein [Planctomycetaceae bacterium]
PPPAPSAGANLAQRLMQVHMCVIYLFAGISKLQGEAWWNGEAMWRAFANLEYQSADMTWLAWYPWLLDLSTHVAVLWELSFCVLVWSRRLRPLVLAGAVVLHVGIGACLGMWTFGLIMLVGCASFLPAAAVRRLVAALAPGRARPRATSRARATPVGAASPAGLRGVVLPSFPSFPSAPPPRRGRDPS